jgi:hypothetical protein
MEYDCSKDEEYLENSQDPLAKEILSLRETIKMLERRTSQKIESIENPLMAKRELQKYFQSLYKNILTR